MARPPDRKRNVFFLGAGFSCAAGLPNTAALLSQVHELAQANPSWGVSRQIGQRLEDAYDFFYPDKGTNFRPEVVDFFSVLTAYNQVDRKGLPDGFPDRVLLADLRFAVVHVLCEGLRGLTDKALSEPHDLLDRMLVAGNVVVTTNWDTIVERAAAARGVKYRLCGQPKDGELLILKLHGSIDWLRPADAKKPVGKLAYSTLTELSSTKARVSKPSTASDIIRTRIPKSTTAWQTIKSSTEEPFMLTMTPGKADSLGPVLELWEHAYRSISAAKNLEVIGYSMPADDIEIRTLLRAGVLRGPSNPNITVRNPAPDVHARFRELILRQVTSDYSPVPVLG